MLTLRSKALALGVTNFEASRAYLFDISTKLGCNVLKYGIYRDLRRGQCGHDSVRHGGHASGLSYEQKESGIRFYYVSLKLKLL